mgnify:CR=1
MKTTANVKTSYVDLWISSLTKPVDTFSSENGKGNKTKIAVNVFFASVIVVLGSTLAQLRTFDLIAALLAVISGTLMTVFVGGIFFVLARILGGKSSFENQLYLTTLFSVPIALLNSIVILIPIVGNWLGLVLLIYLAYLLTLSLKEAHALSTLKAVATWLISVVILTVLMIVITYFYYGSLTPLSA